MQQNSQCSHIRASHLPYYRDNSFNRSLEGSFTEGQNESVHSGTSAGDCGSFYAKVCGGPGSHFPSCVRNPNKAICTINGITSEVRFLYHSIINQMHSSAKLQSPPLYIVFLRACDQVYHRQEVLFLLYLVGQIVISQQIVNITNLLD